MPRQYTPKTKLVCATCGTEYLKAPSQVSRGRQFCSQNCHYAFQELPDIRAANLLDRFWRHVDKTASCWLWTGRKSGRGQLQTPDRTQPRRIDGSYARKIFVAARFSWELHNGPIPKGMEVCHNCPNGDNPLCVNPAHLFLGTHADNMSDAAPQ